MISNRPEGIGGGGRGLNTGSGVAPAAERFAKRTGRRIIQDRKGAQILNERAAGGRKISKIAARREAERAAGRRARREGGSKQLTSIAPKPRAKITTKTSKYRGYGTLTKDKTTVAKPAKPTSRKRNEITITRITPKKSSDVREARAKEKNARIRALLTPSKPRGTRSGGKAILGPKTNPRTILVAKPGKAKDVNKLINAPRGRMGDPAKGDVPKQIESRRVALENAANDSRNASQPSTKTPAEREKEFRPDTNRVGEVRAKDPEQREADRRVAEGLRDPRVRAQDAAKEKATTELAKSDKRIERSIKQGPKKTFRGKVKK